MTKRNAGDKFNITMKIKKVIYEKAGNHYKIFTALIKEQENQQTKAKSGKYLKTEETIIGDVIILEKDDTMTAQVEVCFNKRYGYALRLVTVPEMVLPSDKASLVDFLVRKVKGCGKATAVKIVDTYGMNTFDVVVEDEQALTSIGLTDKKAKTIRDSVIKASPAQGIYAFLADAGNIPISKSLLIYEQLGGNALLTIRKNPYAMMEVEGVAFKYADAVANTLNLKVDGEKRIEAGLIEIIKERVNNYGDMAIKEKSLVEGVIPFLNKRGEYETEQNKTIQTGVIKDVIEKATKAGRLRKEKNNKGEWLYYLPKFWTIENSIVKSLVARFQEDLIPLVNPLELDTEIENRVNASIEQKQAIKMAISEKLSILTGGPGVGKTFTVNSIVETIEALNPNARIVLMAPTGKAAKRMAEVTKREASTIHRKLKISEFQENEGDILEAEFVIIDESSMIDASLFSKLLQHTSSEARILLVGDIDQLPSVGAGLILRDLIDSGMIQVTRLTQVFRQAQGSDIVKNAHKIIKGIDTKRKNGIQLKEQLSDMIFLKEEQEEEIQAKIVKHIQNELKTGTRMEDIVVLSAMRKGEIGVYELNRAIQETVNAENDNKSEIKREKKTRSGQEITETIRENDRVMQLVNNNEKDVMNGEIGTVERIYQDTIEDEKGVTKSVEIVEVNYGQDKIVRYLTSELNEIELAYAMTIHKSQGSEYKKVFIPVHESHAIMLQRNLLYTAVTRAKEELVLVGSEDAFNKGIARNESINRLSLLKEKLQTALAQPQVV